MRPRCTICGSSNQLRNIGGEFVCGYCNNDHIANMQRLRSDYETMAEDVRAQFIEYIKNNKTDMSSYTNSRYIYGDHLTTHFIARNGDILLVCEFYTMLNHEESTVFHRMVLGDRIQITCN